MCVKKNGRWCLSQFIAWILIISTESLFQSFKALNVCKFKASRRLTVKNQGREKFPLTDEKCTKI